MAYDVDRPGSARLAGLAVGGSPFLHPVVLFFGGLGVLLLAAATINFAVEILTLPLALAGPGAGGFGRTSAGSGRCDSG